MEKVYNFLVPLMRAFLGIFGVDCFILKDTKRGVKRIVGTVLTYMFIFFFSISIIKIHYAYIALLILFIRFLYYLITGLKLLKKGKEKVLEYYFNNDKSKEELRRKNKFLDIFFKVLING